MKNTDEKILRLISVLRGRRGCAWDRRQTVRTLAPLLIEEAYEIVEAIERGRANLIQEEIGDLLFLVLSIVHAAESKRMLTYQGVIQATVEKYISRHPHVFKTKSDLTPSQILVQWEKQKAQKSRRHPIDGVPRYLPALYQAKRLYDKASRLGLQRTRRHPPNRRVKRQWIGKKLLALVRLAVQSGIDPEMALRYEIRLLRTMLKRSDNCTPR